MKKIALGFCFFITLLLASCSFFEKEDDPVKPTPQPKPEIVVTGISLLDEEGNKVEKVTALQEFSENAVYNHTGVYVVASYSNDTTRDVTVHAQFSEVDLTKKGDVTVEVTYQTFKESYIVSVIDNVLTDIVLSLGAVRLVYQVGETLSTEGLIVSGVYKSGSHKIVEEYDIEIGNKNHQKISKNTPFSVSDIYDVLVKVESIEKSYQIAVYSDHYSNSNVLNVTQYALTENLTFTSAGTFAYTESHSVFADSLSSLELQKTIFRTKDINGDSIAQTYKGTTYTTALEVSDQQDIRLTLTQKTDLLMVVGGINGRGIVFTNVLDKTKHQYAIGNVNELASLLYIQLEAGSYEVAANYGTLLLYSMEYCYD
ncbi:MAG: hypothetical protein K2N64_01960 [Anaeroplasmataceae bacterium]|nr:hypothetical protein [Anaeroplasmataceae bacterium]